jgi:hypothetical protein
VQIKAQGLLNAARWIEAEYGRDALGEIIRACSPPVRESYVSGIAINWHPVEEFIEFIDQADRAIGRGRGQLAEEIGAAGARANFKGTLVRAALYLAQPEFFFRRIAGLWRQFNDEGEMRVQSLEEHTSSLEVTGLKSPNATFCAVLTGWTRQMAISLGAQNPAVRHVRCRARGDARCLWDIRWTGIDRDESERKPSSGTESSSALRASPPVRYPSSGNVPATNPSSARPSTRGPIPSTETTSRPPSGRPPSSGKVPSVGETMPSSSSRLPRRDSGEK